MAMPRSGIKQASFRNIVRARLQESGVDADKFLSSMPKHRAQISGGFLLECMLGIRFSNDQTVLISGGGKYEAKSIDVDVYSISQQKFIEEKGNDYRRQSLSTLVERVRPWTHDFDFLTEADPTSSFDKYDHVYTNEDRVKFPIQAHKFKIGSLLLDWILVNPDKFQGLPSFVSVNFDISICKNLFDGEMLRICHLKDLQERSFMARLPPKLDYQSVFGGYSGRDTGAIVLNSLQVSDRRVEKYISRGFKLTFKQSFKNWLSRAKKRYDVESKKLEQERKCMETGLQELQNKMQEIERQKSILTSTLYNISCEVAHSLTGLDQDSRSKLCKEYRDVRNQSCLLDEESLHLDHCKQIIRNEFLARSQKMERLGKVLQDLKKPIREYQ